MRHAYHEDDEPCGIHISQLTVNWKEKKKTIKRALYVQEWS
jgi:hypothetical protein